MKRALVLVALAACSSRDPKSHATGSAGSANVVVAAGSGSGSASVPPADAGDADAAETFGSTAATVTLEKPGAEPRRAIEYAPHAGRRTAKLTFTTGMDDTPKGMAMGAIVTFTWKTPADAGHPYELAVVESKAQLPANAKDGETKIIGAVGAMYSAVTVRVDADARGRARLVRTSDTLPTNPSLLWLLHPMFVAFPAEPIGLGARWQVKEPLEMNNLAGDATSTYEVTAIKGDTISVEVHGVTHWRDATGSAGDTLDQSLDGTLVVGTGDLLPVTADLTSTQDLGVAKAQMHLRLGP